ncbi:hypothetical protein ANCCAN_19964 [Ancylostoma caninum]|uniref:Peptidase A2 domain-containing protein n=1 Tax=Ancylostoma caninum TaxID=29170 RepID=A0A368FT54_ANCCA|nr:hypothetical protein ANCCAN_19964 [Ancylostoma caninum]
MAVEDNSPRKRNGEIFLLTGTLQALHPRAQQLLTLQVLLDTGADRSFIDGKLAKELGLPNHGSITMNLRTFGAETPMKVQCISTSLNVWDADGVQHQLRLYTQDNLTKNFSEGILLLTDSEIVLKWLQCAPRRLGAGPYVKNRVREIHNITQTMKDMRIEVSFGYIDTRWNPADVGTRGATAQELRSHIWWKGYPLKELRKKEFTSTFFHLSTEQDEAANILEEVDFDNNVHLNSRTSTEEAREILNLAAFNDKMKAVRTLAVHYNEDARAAAKKAPKQVAPHCSANKRPSLNSL